MKKFLPQLFLMAAIFLLDTASYSQEMMLPKAGTVNSIQYRDLEGGYYPDSCVSYNYTGSIDSVRNEKVNYGWSQDGKITMRATYKWIIGDNRWKGTNREDTEYEINGNPKRTQFYSWDTISCDWYLLNRKEYLYNDSDDLIEESQYLYELNSPDYDLVSRLRYNYTYTDYYTEYVVTRFDINTQNTWDTTARREYIYNSNFQLILRKSSSWNKDDGKWIYSSVDSMLYDESERLAEASYYNWNDGNKEWEGSLKAEFKEYTGDNATLQLYYKWSSVTKTWYLEGKEEIGFSETGKQTSLLGFYWKNSSYWQSTVKLIVDYDIYDNCKRYSWYGFDEDTDGWYTTHKSYYYYPYSEALGFNKATPEFFKVYPGIVNDFLNIETEETRSIVKLYDLNGRLLSSFTLNKGLNTFYLGDFQSGMYILKPTSTGSNFAVKIFKL